MAQRLRAVYKGGAFIPGEPCDLPEGSEVEIVVHGPSVLPPKVQDPDERKRILATVVERMLQNPIGDGAPHLTREEMHERR